MGAKEGKGWIVQYLLAPVIVGLVILFFQDLFVDQEDIRFSISSPISSTIVDSSKEVSIQEIVVSNIGSKKASDVIFISDNNSIESYEIVKSVKTDIIQESFIDGHLEIRYPSLLPSENFKLVVYSRMVIYKSDIKVKHKDGIGKDIYNSSGVRFGFIEFFIIFIFYIAFDLFFSLYKSGFESDSRYNCEKNLRRNKPIVLFRAKWNEIKEKAIDTYMAELGFYRSSKSVSESNSFKYLNGQCLDFVLDEEQKKRANKKAVESLEKAAIDAIKYARGETEAARALSVVASVCTDEDSDIRLSISKEWLSRASNNLDLFRLSSLRDYVERYFNRPEHLYQDHWKDYRSSLGNRLYRDIRSLLDSDSFFEDTLISEEYASLPDDVRTFIEEENYKSKMSKVPSAFYSSDSARRFLEDYDFSWMTDGDANKVKELAETHVDLFEDREKSRNLLIELNHIVNFGTLSNGTKVDREDEFFEGIVKLEKDIAVQKENISASKKSISEDKFDLDMKKDKVDKQLKIIALALEGEKESVMSLEYPENIFNDYNFENLRKIVLLTSE